MLFDSYFSAPKTIIALKKKEHLDTIAMLKKSKTKYVYSGEKLNVKEIYRRNKKRRGCSPYDAMNAHVAIVFARYMMLSVARREN